MPQEFSEMTKSLWIVSTLEIIPWICLQKRIHWMSNQMWKTKRLLHRGTSKVCVMVSTGRGALQRRESLRGVWMPFPVERKGLERRTYKPLWTIKSKATTQPNVDEDVQLTCCWWGCRMLQIFSSLVSYCKTEHTVTIKSINCAPVYIPKWDENLYLRWKPALIRIVSDQDVFQ